MRAIIVLRSDVLAAEDALSGLECYLSTDDEHAASIKRKYVERVAHVLAEHLMDVDRSWIIGE